MNKFAAISLTIVINLVILYGCYLATIGRNTLLFNIIATLEIVIAGMNLVFAFIFSLAAIHQTDIKGMLKIKYAPILWINLIFASTYMLLFLHTGHYFVAGALFINILSDYAHQELAKFAE